MNVIDELLFEIYTFFTHTYKEKLLTNLKDFSLHESTFKKKLLKRGKKTRENTLWNKRILKKNYVIGIKYGGKKLTRFI